MSLETELEKLKKLIKKAVGLVALFCGCGGCGAAIGAAVAAFLFLLFSLYATVLTNPGSSIPDAFLFAAGANSSVIFNLLILVAVAGAVVGAFLGCFMAGEYSLRSLFCPTAAPSTDSEQPRRNIRSERGHQGYEGGNRLEPDGDQSENSSPDSVVSERFESRSLGGNYSFRTLFAEERSVRGDVQVDVVDASNGENQEYVRDSHSRVPGRTC